MEQKKCTCQEPKLIQQLPEGFKGLITCAECKGVAEYPRNVKKYDGSDEIEHYLFSLNANAKAMTVEKAILKMLLRVEAALLKLVPAAASTPAPATQAKPEKDEPKKK